MASMAVPFPGVLGGVLPSPEVPYPTGILYPGQKARIMKDDGTLAKPGETGELHVSGRNLAQGYWNNQKSTEETFHPDGWMRTGDRFWADKNGYFLFVYPVLLLPGLYNIIIALQIVKRC